MATGTDLFEQLANDLAGQGMERSTMMGSTCLRFNGQFCGMLHVKTGELVVKLPAARVEQLVAAGTGATFAPNGRVFREWVAVDTIAPQLWRELLVESRDLAATKA